MTTSVRSISDDPLARVIVNVCQAMRADFHERFNRQFADETALREFKRRLYKLLRGTPVRAIVDGYERCVTERPGFIPTAPEIAAAATAVAAEQRREDAEEARAQYAQKQLPKYPEEAPYRPGDGAEALRFFANAKEAAKAGDEADRRRRLAEKLVTHTDVIAAHYQAGNIRRVRTEGSLCAAGCGKPGTMGHGTSGNSRWYCGDCFNRA